MQQTFRDSISAIVPPSLVSLITFIIYIDGVQTVATGGLIIGDSEGYFSTDTTKITVTRS
jgi:hypothetical protein